MKPAIFLSTDYGTKDLSVVVAFERLANGDIVILDTQPVPTPAIEIPCFETEKLKPRQEPWYRKFDKRKRR